MKYKKWQRLRMRIGLSWLPIIVVVLLFFKVFDLLKSIGKLIYEANNENLLVNLKDIRFSIVEHAMAENELGCFQRRRLLMRDWQCMKGNLCQLIRIVGDVIRGGGLLYRLVKEEDTCISWWNMKDNWIWLLIKGGNRKYTEEKFGWNLRYTYIFMLDIGPIGLENFWMYLIVASKIYVSKSHSFSC